MNITKLLLNCNSWQDFKRQLQALSDKQKGDCFEELTKYFLRIHPAYRIQLRNVWPLKDVPPSIHKRLNLPGLDEGIDLIAETKDRTFWAIQCKYRDDESRSLTRKELSTFTDLAFAISKNIELGLVCTTADRFSHKLTLYGDRISFCSSEIWQSLDRDFFRQLHAVLRSKAAIIKPVSPREHQERAIKSAYEHYIKQKNSRGKLIMPCGTGKSLTGYWLADRLGAKTILVAVPSLALIRQTLQVWSRESVANGQDVNWIAVCSDDSVGDFEKDDLLMLTQDLGIRVHTSPVEIAGWLKKHKKSRTVVFSTYQSGKAISAAAKRAGIVFDLAILDEAHKTVGKKDSLFSHLLYDKNIRIKKRLFMTATERYYRGKSEEIASMDNPDIYGDTFEMLSFKSALEAQKPILSDYKIATILVSRNEITEIIKENRFVKPDRGKWDKEVEAENLAALVALRKAMKKYPIRHAVSFHSSIVRAKVFKDNQDIFSKVFPEYGKLSTFHVSGKTPTAIRSREINEFASAKRSLITNARCLTEGVDVPNIDCVLFADPKNSTVDIVQAVGRALRPSPGKEYGYVIVPVLLDGEIDKVSESNAFSSILTVLRALAANDERIVEYFRSISQGKKRVAGAKPFSIDVPDGLVINAQEFINSIELKFWSRLAKLSWRPFEEAREFVRGLGLKSRNDWEKYCKDLLSNKGVKPKDIPFKPQRTYKEEGWINWGDWLGTGTIAPFLRIYRPFKEARVFARSLHLKSGSEWQKYCKGELPLKGNKPDDIPFKPYGTYKNDGWISMGDWLETGTVAPQLRRYRPFKEARAFVQNLGLRNQAEWELYCSGALPAKGKKPDDIPFDPRKIYKKQGWINLGDWLGTGNVANFLRQYRPFKEARSFVHNLQLKNQGEWRIYALGKLQAKGARPTDIPSNPHRTYRQQGWLGYGDWIGTGAIAPRMKNYRSFTDARQYVHGLQLRGQAEWLKYCKGEILGKYSKPDDIPASPERTYKNKGWISMGDWLGTGSIAPSPRIYRNFLDARAYVQKLGLKNRNEWQLYSKGKLTEKGIRPDDIPSNPHRDYEKKGWSGYGDWIGSGAIAPQLRKFRVFRKARAFVQSLNMRNIYEWKKYCQGLLPEKGRKPDDIPAYPNQTYKGKGWVGMGDWLGRGAIAPFIRKCRSFEEARIFARSLSLKNQQEWRQYCQGRLLGKDKKPDDIPAAPQSVYKEEGWISLGDWLGTGTIASHLIEYRPFNKARSFVRKLGLKSISEWQIYCKGSLTEKGKKPDDIPNAPHMSYKAHGWVSWGDWFGSGTIATRLREYRSFKEARAFVRKLDLSNGDEWRKYYKGEFSALPKKPSDIPANPDRTYKNKGWVSWPDWLRK